MLRLSPEGAPVDSRRFLDTSKLSPPRTPTGTLDRIRLWEALDSTPGGSTALLIAGPGWGKSTALAGWARRTKGRLAWLTADALDNDPERFWQHELAALDRAGGRGDLSVVGTDPVGQVLEFLERRHIRWLVLDDVHLLTGPAVLDGLARVLEHLGPGTSAVLATRHDPGLRLGRLRAAGHLLEFDESDLRLSVTETSTLAGPLHSPAVVRRLHKATEGWAAGSQLALQTAAGSSDPVALLDGVTGTERGIAQYLMEEVLARFDDVTRRLLIDICVADRLTPDLAAALSGLPDAGQRLRALSDQRLFVVRVGATTPQYRFHEMFSGLLRDVLADDAERMGTQRRLAGGWFEESGDIPAAIDQFLAAGAVEDARRLIEANLDRYVAHGRAEVLLAWWARLPPVPLPPGWWELTRLWTLARAGRFEEAGRELESFSSPREDRALAAELAALSSFLAFRVGDLAGAERHATTAVELARALSVRPQMGPALAAAALSRIALFKGEPERALELSLQGADLAGEDRAALPAFIGTRAAALWGCSRPAEALVLARESISTSPSAPDWLGGSIDARLVLAAELENAGRISAAAAELDLAIGETRHLQLPVMEVLALVDLAAMRARNGEPEAGQLAAAEADKLVRHHAMSPDLVRWLAATNAALAATEATLPVVRLTERERQILEQLPTRLTKAEIADELVVSVNTVKHHTKSLYRKLGAVNRDEAIRAARTAQLLD
jgi:LuxR family maltose regulon positive regulatory protein